MASTVKMNKQVDVDLAIKRFKEEEHDEVEAGVEKERDAEEEKRRNETRAFLNFLEAECGAKKNSEYITRKYVDKVLNYRYIELSFGMNMSYGQSIPGPTGYSEAEIDTILKGTLTSQGPEMEPGSSVTDACGYISNCKTGDQEGPGDTFTCTRMGTGGLFELHQKLTWPGMPDPDYPPIIEVFLKGADGKTGKYLINNTYLSNSGATPGTIYSANATEMVPLIRYNALSLQASRAEFDYIKSGKAAQDKEAGKKRGFNLNMSVEQAFEFKVAFDVVAEENEPGSTSNAVGAGIPEDRIADVFLAVGYTLMDHDMAFILELAQPNADGLYMSLDLQEAFEAWRQSQLSVENLRACFSAVVGMQKMPQNFDHVERYMEVIPGDATLPSEALRNALNDAMHLDGENKLKLPDIQGVEDEISSNPEKHITFADFIDIFRS